MKQTIKNRIGAVLGTASLMAGSAATHVFAAGVADTGVTTAMSGMSDDLIATVGAVAPYGVGIMVLFLGFRYGKKIFKIIANG